MVVRPKISAAPARATFVATCKLPSGGKAIVTNSAAEPDSLHERTGSLTTLGHGSVFWEPWGIRCLRGDAIFP